MLSSRIVSTPSASASSSCASVSTSSSIFAMWPRPARTRSMAGAMPPAATRWLSLISTASSRPKRWLKPPPQRTAYFSSTRRPGVVLRVQTMRAFVPATASTSARVAVATPERWPTKFSATRSAVRMPRAGAFDRREQRAGVDASCRPASAISKLQRRDRPDGTRIRAAISPAIVPGLRATSLRAQARLRRHDQFAGDVARAAEILLERMAHDGFDEQSDAADAVKGRAYLRGSGDLADAADVRVRRFAHLRRKDGRGSASASVMPA